MGVGRVIPSPPRGLSPREEESKPKEKPQKTGECLPAGACEPAAGPSQPHLNIQVPSPRHRMLPRMIPDSSPPPSAISY